MSTGELAPRVREAIKDVDVDPDARTARVGDREVTAKTAPDLVFALAYHIYEHVHCGRSSDRRPRRRDLRDPAVEAGLFAATPHRTTTVPVRPVGLAREGAVPVLIDGVRVLAPPDALVAEALPAGGAPVVRLRLAAARPALSPGFFLADSSRPRSTDGPVLRVYLHLTSIDDAPLVWGSVLRRLEAAGAGYRAKICSAAEALPRRDGMVVYLGPGEWGAVDVVLEATAGLPLGAATSPFTEELAPGVAIAWEPDDNRPGRSEMSFGEHRAMAVAEGLITAGRADAPASGAGAPPDGPTTGVHVTTREAAVAAAMRGYGIDPRRPARNFSSPPLARLTPEEG